MLSPLCSQQCSKLTSASPVDLLAEDGFSFIGLSILFSFPHLQSSCPLAGLLPLQSFVAFIRVSDRIGSVVGQLEPAGIDSLLFLFVSDPYFRIETSRCGLSTAAGLRCELAKVFLRSRVKLCGQPLTRLHVVYSFYF